MEWAKLQIFCYMQKDPPPFIPASDGSYLGAKNFVKRETHERAVSFKTNYK